MAWTLAKEAGCDPATVCAICEQESGWNQWAIRYEPLFFDRYIRPLFIKDVKDGGLRDYTEARARTFSWGLMQVMGQVAREQGYRGPLPMLCDPETGIRVGIEVWQGKLKAAEGDVEKALELYNGGGNPSYAAQVLARRDRYAQKPAG
jgi:Transglycosylase SLT domain